MSTEPDFDRLVYFGDSLTDSGNIFAATSAVAFFGLPPEAAGYAQQFSNGDVYADLAPQLLSVEGGEALNYAVGGAQVLTARTVEDVLAGTGLIRPDATAEDLSYGVDYAAQVARFLSDTAGEDLSSTAVSILIGVNDFDDFVATSFDPAIVAGQALAYGSLIAQTTLTVTFDMAIAGVGTIILNTIPDGSVFPFFDQIGPGEQFAGSLISAGYNATLRAGAEQLEATGAEVVIVEWGAMLEEIDADSESFGFRFFDQQYLLGTQGSGGVNPLFFDVPIEQVGFFDSVHPASELHEIMGVFQAESLTSDVTIGTGNSEEITGGNSDDLILARAGDDKISLGNGDDVAIAGTGNDIVTGGNGKDLIAGGAGNDMLKGGNGADIIADGTGDDVSKGGNGDDLLIDGAGADMAYGGNGSDVFIFTEDAIFGRETGDMNFFDGGRGHDTLILRMTDPLAELATTQCGAITHYTDLGLSTTGIEEVFVVAYNVLPAVDGFEEAFQIADDWHFV